MYVFANPRQDNPNACRWSTNRYTVPPCALLPGTSGKAGNSMSSGQAASPVPGSAFAWWLAARPWSFTISLAPVLAGTALAMLHGHGAQVDLVAAALFASILIHCGTNLQNDVGDFRRGADGSGRLGPPRATTEGWLTASQVQTAANLSFAAAFIPGSYLVMKGGWPIAIIGVTSVIAGAIYTAGPRP